MWRQRAAAHTRKSKYGIVPAQQAELLAAQGGHCALCDVPRHAFDLDHDHATGRVRGLVCHSCNVMIGYVERDPALFATPLVLAYLRGPWAPDVGSLIRWYEIGGPRGMVRT